MRGRRSASPHANCRIPCVIASIALTGVMLFTWSSLFRKIATAALPSSIRQRLTKLHGRLSVSPIPSGKSERSRPGTVYNQRA
jgi:hypothetical protein